MRSTGSYKFRGTICQSIGIILYSLLVGFGIYLFFVNHFNTLGIIVTDLYVGIVGLIFSIIGIFAFFSMSGVCLDLMRGYSLVNALACIFFTVFHCIIPMYNDFGDGSNTVVNLFFVTASGFIVSFIQNLYSYYVSNSLHKIRMAELAELAEEDIESVGSKNNALDCTGFNHKMESIH